MQVLIVGLGSMGKRRIRNLQALGVSKILGFDPRSDRAEEAEEKYGIQTICDFSEVQLGVIDRMVISTSPDQHMYYAHIAADHKIPCFIEASVVDTDMLQLIEKQERDLSLIICPSCTFYFHPAIKKITELLAQEAIGAVSNFSYHFGQYLPDWHPWEPIQAFYVSKRETGGCREIVPFELTWMGKLFGNIHKVSGFYAKTIALKADIADTYVFNLQYKSGVLGSVVVDVVSRVATRRLIINGEQGQIRWDWDRPQVELYQADKQAWNIISFAAGHAEQGYNANIMEEMYIEEIDTFLQAAEGRKTFPNLLKQDYEVLQLLYAIEKSNRGE